MSNKGTLQPFKKGELWKGNKDGRPVGSKNVKTYLREALDMELPYGEGKHPVSFIIVQELIKKAISNKSAKIQIEAIRELLDRSIGRPIQGNINLNSDLLESKDIKDMLGNSFEVVENENQ